MERRQKVAIGGMLAAASLLAIYSFLDYANRFEIRRLYEGLLAMAFQLTMAYMYWHYAKMEDSLQSMLEGRLPPPVGSRGVFVGFFKPRLARWYRRPAWVHFLVLLALAFASAFALIYTEPRLAILVPISMAVLSLFQEALRKWLQSVFGGPQG